jgi:error-prone DNA polymerase
VVVLGPDVNRSQYDCTVEPVEADPDDVVTYYGMKWRRGRGPAGDPLRPAGGLRMGLRYVRNLGDAEITRIEAARQFGDEFSSIEDLAQRTGLPVDALEGLAAAGALTSIGIGRREGIWAAGAVAALGPDRLPLAVGVDAPPLPGMSELEEMQADLWGTGVSRRHPVEFVREQLSELGCLTVAEALAVKGHGKRARIGGIVIHRQRPSTANGVMFFNLEDETGLLNIVVLPPVWEAQKEVARKEVGLVIDGVLEYRDGVTNLVAHRFEPLVVEKVKTRDFR